MMMPFCSAVTVKTYGCASNMKANAFWTVLRRMAVRLYSDCLGLGGILENRHKIVFIIISQRKIVLTMIVMWTICLGTDASVADSVMHLSKSKGSVYELMDMLSRKTGRMFIYDSNVIFNDKRSRISEGDYTLAQAVQIISGKDNLQLREMGNHILVGTLEVVTPNHEFRHHAGYTVIEGTVVDRVTRQPLGFVSVRIDGSSIGTVANGNGMFRLSIPDTLRQRNILFSTLGYQSKSLNASLLRQQTCTIELDEYVTTLQEIVVRMTNPQTLLDEMRHRMKLNYAVSPAYTTAFYREGVERNKQFIKLSEGVFRVYKSSMCSEEPEQVKLLKMRTLSSVKGRDTIVAKIKAGVEACMMLDLVKNMPDFMQPSNNDYRFFSTGITTIENRTANTIYFEQKPAVTEPLYCGELYIDSEDYALLGAHFEINPAYVKSTTDMFIEKKSHDMQITPQKICYKVSYSRMGAHYYVSYVRGDLEFKIKINHRLFSTSHVHLWLEMATCNIDTLNVRRFEKNELLSKSSVFEDVHFVSDQEFWEGFNVIPTERDLSESISKIALKIEEKLAR